MPVIEEQEPKVVLEGRTCEIVCSANGRPLPQISWRRAINSNDYLTGIQPVRNNSIAFGSSIYIMLPLLKRLNLTTQETLLLECYIKTVIKLPHPVYILLALSGHFKHNSNISYYIVLLCYNVCNKTLLLMFRHVCYLFDGCVL